MLGFFSSVRGSGSYCIIVSSDPPATSPRPNGKTHARLFCTRSWLMSSKRDDPAIDQHGGRPTAAGRLSGDSRLARRRERDGDAENTANQKTEQMSPNIDALSARSEHREKSKSCGNRQPGAALARCLSSRHRSHTAE